MRIAFITSCLEPGRDGVGDYTTILARACAERGHSVCRFALADHYVSDVESEDSRRMGPPLPWKARIERVRDALQRFTPDMVSLQFVCYGFAARGLPVRIAARIKEIVRNAPVHLMLHELWIGAEVGARLKHRLIGALQRGIVRSLVSRLQPCAIHTSNAAYVHLLGRERIGAECLPLFGNIPVAETQPSAVAPLRMVMFGAIPPVWSPEPLIERLETMAFPIEIVHVGRGGPGEGVWDQLTSRSFKHVRFRKLGERSAGEISEIFCSASAGIATAPWNLIGKSGSAVAMLEHGLPVIVSRDDVQFVGFSPAGPIDPFLIKVSELSSRWPLPRRNAQSRVRGVATQFLTSLESCVR